MSVVDSQSIGPSHRQLDRYGGRREPDTRAHSEFTSFLTVMKNKDGANNLPAVLHERIHRPIH